jgi:hypothetical protein
LGAGRFRGIGVPLGRQPTECSARRYQLWHNFIAVLELGRSPAQRRDGDADAIQTSSTSTATGEYYRRMIKVRSVGDDPSASARNEPWSTTNSMLPDTGGNLLSRTRISRAF